MQDIPRPSSVLSQNDCWQRRHFRPRKRSRSSNPPPRIPLWSRYRTEFPDIHHVRTTMAHVYPRQDLLLPHQRRHTLSHIHLHLSPTFDIPTNPSYNCSRQRNRFCHRHSLALFTSSLTASRVRLCRCSTQQS